jgi:hypothetical protein
MRDRMVMYTDFANSCDHRFTKMVPIPTPVQVIGGVQNAQSPVRRTDSGETEKERRFVRLGGQTREQ